MSSGTYPIKEETPSVVSVPPDPHEEVAPETIQRDGSAGVASAAAIPTDAAAVEINENAEHGIITNNKVKEDETANVTADDEKTSPSEDDKTSLSVPTIQNTTAAAALITTITSQDEKGNNHVIVDPQARTTTTITTTMTPARIKFKPNADSTSGIQDFVPLTMFLWIIVPEERDVITGRGKRAGAWPGNIYFRQMVNRYRDAYHKSVRSVKCQIAQKVVDAIHANGGRFLDEAIVVVNNDSASSENAPQQPALERRGWILMDPPKILEKTCQALREKIKAKTPLDIDPFVGKEAIQKMIAQNRERDERKRQLQSKMALMKSLGIPYHSNKYQFSNAGGETSAFKLVKPKTTSTISLKRKSTEDETNAGATTATTLPDTTLVVSEPPTKKPRLRFEDPAVRPEKPQAPLLTFPPADIMLKKLETFRKKHGHLIVPIEWSEDIVLADWCIYMRQLYREVRAGYRSERQDPNNRDEKSSADSNKPLQEQMDKITETDSAPVTAGNGLEEGTTANPEATTKSEEAQLKSLSHPDVLSVEQQELLDLLQVMGFCWDYEEWHWNYQFLKLQENPSLVREWVREMRSEYQRGRLDPYRVAKLQSEGVLLW